MFKLSQWFFSFQGGAFCGCFMLILFYVCVCYAVLSVPCSLVITCWERSGLWLFYVLCFLVILCTTFVFVYYESWSTSELIRVSLVPLNIFKHSSNLFTGRSKAVLLLWILFVNYVSFFCPCYVFLYVSCSFVITCWERVDLLALLYVMYVLLSISNIVFRIRCGTWLYRFLIYAFFFTLTCV